MKCKPRKKHEFQLKNLKQKDEQKKKLIKKKVKKKHLNSSKSTKPRNLSYANERT